MQRPSLKWGRRAFPASALDGLEPGTQPCRLLSPCLSHAPLSAQGSGVHHSVAFTLERTSVCVWGGGRCDLGFEQVTFWVL